MNLGTKPMMSMPSSSVPDQFPAGLRVLVVDDDPTCLKILEKMLRNCLYEVTKCNRAEVALSLLRENKNGFDIVISDVHMPDMDGFKLLEHIGLEMDLPVIMMSADDSKHVVMKGVTHGACDYLIKPVRIEALRNIWQHVVRKKKNEWREFDTSVNVDEGDQQQLQQQQQPQQQQQQQQKQSEECDYSSSANEGSWRNAKRRKEEEEETEERDDSSSMKKPRVVWSVELHQQFVAAVNQLGIDKAVPKKILELMNVPGLTRENVASHLQKYRLYLRRLSGQHHQNGLIPPFMGPDSSFGTISSLNGLELQALAASGQLPPQSLATLQAAALGRSNHKASISMPLIDQRNLFSFENPKLRFGESQQQEMNNSNSGISNKHANLLHGIPTNMEAKQLANLHHSAQHSLAAMNNSGSPHSTQNGPMLVQMGQTQSRPQSLIENNMNNVSKQPVLTSAAGSGVYKPVSQGGSSLVDFSLNHKNELPGSNFLVGGNTGVPIITSNGMMQENASLLVKGPRGVVPSYDIFDDLNQHKAQDWSSQNSGLTFGAWQNRNTSYGKAMFSSGQESGLRNGSNMAQQQNTFHGDSSLRVKAERFHFDGLCQPTLFPEQFGQEDLMSALLKQQESIGPVETEFAFDGYALDNLPL